MSSPATREVLDRLNTAFDVHGLVTVRLKEISQNGQPPVSKFIQNYGGVNGPGTWTLAQGAVHWQILPGNQANDTGTKVDIRKRRWILFLKIIKNSAKPTHDAVVQAIHQVITDASQTVKRITFQYVETGTPPASGPVPTEASSLNAAYSVIDIAAPGNASEIVRHITLYADKLFQNSDGRDVTVTIPGSASDDYSPNDNDNKPEPDPYPDQ